jgi:nucleotide-binding universal stress UspA family protein
MKVVVGVDGSSNSFAAVEFAGRLLSPDRDSLLLFFAVPTFSFEEDSLDPAVEQRARDTLVRVVLDAAIERLPENWRSKVEARSETGSASAALLEAIDAEGADLVAVGFRGTSGIWEEFMLGSVSRAVVHSAKIPVLVVKSGRVADEPAKQSPGPATKHLHVLVGYDGPPFAERIAAQVSLLTWPKETQGWVIRVVQPFRLELPEWVQLRRDPDVAAMAAAWEQEHQQNLEAARNEVAQFCATLPPCFARDGIIVEGRPAEEIIKQIREKSIDLAVLGSRGSGAVKRLLLGSTSDQVLREAPCSVLIVR